MNKIINILGNIGGIAFLINAIYNTHITEQEKAKVQKCLIW